MPALPGFETVSKPATRMPRIGFQILHSCDSCDSWFLSSKALISDTSPLIHRSRRLISGWRFTKVLANKHLRPRRASTDPLIKEEGGIGRFPTVFSHG